MSNTIKISMAGSGTSGLKYLDAIKNIGDWGLMPAYWGVAHEVAGTPACREDGRGGRDGAWGDVVARLYVLGKVQTLVSPHCDTASCKEMATVEFLT